MLSLETDPLFGPEQGMTLLRTPAGYGGAMGLPMGMPRKLSWWRQVIAFWKRDWQRTIARWRGR